MELREGLSKGSNLGHGSGMKPSGKDTEGLLNIVNNSVHSSEASQ